jgi:hypothetical protein
MKRASLPAAEPARPARSIRVTREMVHARTREMAVQAGRAPLQISQADYEQARVELTGESDMRRQEAVLDGSREAPCKPAGALATWENEGGPPAGHSA